MFRAFRDRIIRLSRRCESTRGFPSPTTGFATTTNAKTPSRPSPILPGQSRSPLSGNRQGAILAFLTTAGPNWNDWVKIRAWSSFISSWSSTSLAKTRLCSDGSSESRSSLLQSGRVPRDRRNHRSDANGNRATRVTATRGAGTSKNRRRRIHLTDAAPSRNRRPRKTRPQQPLKPGPTGSRDGDVHRYGLARDVRRPLVQGPGGRPAGTMGRLQRPAGRKRSEDGEQRRNPGAAPNDVHVQIHEPGQTQWIEGHSTAQEARTLLLVPLAVALLAEQLFAHRLSYHPSQAGGPA